MSPHRHTEERRTVTGLVADVSVTVGIVLLMVAASTLTGVHPELRNFGLTAPPGRVATSAPSRTFPRSRLPGAAVRASPGVVPAPPVEVAIPAIAVHAAVRPVRTTHRELAVPANPDQLGWWVASARVGAHTGTTVIDGHVDSAATGPGALFRLTALTVGDRIVVTTSPAQSRTYLVTGRRIYNKAHGLPPSIFTSTGAPRLVLITCGGPFDHATSSYLDNIVIFAAAAPTQVSV
jgi:hypothetical protein